MRIAENLTAFLDSPDSYDCINLSVDGSLESDLSFKNLERKIEEILDLDKHICLELFLNIHADDFLFTSNLAFSVRRRSLEVLLEKIAFIPENKISHIILYRGPIDFSNEIKQNAQLSDEFDHWKANLPGSKPCQDHLLNIFSSKLISDFFHSLATILPDHIKGLLLFSLPQDLGVSKISELTSEETFPHLTVGIKHPPFFMEGVCWGLGDGLHTLSFSPSHSLSESQVKTAVILPFFGFCDYQKFEAICSALKKRGIAFKVIEENLLNEKWFDIDNIIFDYEAASFDGKRMVDGFIAAGGTAYVFDESRSYERENVTAEYGYLSFSSFINENSTESTLNKT